MLIQQGCNFKFCPAGVFLVGDLHNQTAARAALLQGKVTGAFFWLPQFLLVNPSNQTVPMASDPQFQGNFLLLPWHCKVRSSLRPFADSHSAPILRHHLGGLFFLLTPQLCLIPLNHCTLTYAVPLSKLSLEGYMPAF